MLTFPVCGFNIPKVPLGCRGDLPHERGYKLAIGPTKSGTKKGVSVFDVGAKPFLCGEIKATANNVANVLCSLYEQARQAQDRHAKRCTQEKAA